MWIYERVIMFNSIDEIKAAHTGYWFSPDTMWWWGTRVYPDVYQGDGVTYFISSDEGPHGGRLYSVRCATPNGDIRTVGPFQGYATLDAARGAAERLTV